MYLWLSIFNLIFALFPVQNKSQINCVEVCFTIPLQTNEIGHLTDRKNQSQGKQKFHDGWVLYETKILTLHTGIFMHGSVSFIINNQDMTLHASKT